MATCGPGCTLRIRWAGAGACKQARPGMLLEAKLALITMPLVKGRIQEILDMAVKSRTILSSFLVEAKVFYALFGEAERVDSKTLEVAWASLAAVGGIDSTMLSWLEAARSRGRGLPRLLVPCRIALPVPGDAGWPALELVPAVGTGRTAPPSAVSRRW